MEGREGKRKKREQEREGWRREREERTKWEHERENMRATGEGREPQGGDDRGKMHNTNHSTP